MTRRLRIALFFPLKSERFGLAAEIFVNGTASQPPANPRIRVESWEKDEFWGSEPYFPLNQLIRRLHSFDGAILILGVGDFDYVNTGRGLRKRAIDALLNGLGVRPATNSNVLIEVGACLARFGRKRTFILKPASMRLPSYFYINNVNVYEYDDIGKDAAQAIRPAIGKAIEELERLGFAAYYSDLPAFGLAHGYFNNFIKPAIETIESGAEVSIRNGPSAETRVKQFKAVTIVFPYVTHKVLTQPEVTAHQIAIGLVEGSVAASTGGRGKSFFALPQSLDGDTLCLVDVPTNLVPIRDAITTVEELWRRDVQNTEGSRDGDFERLLEEREIDNYLRYLEILMEKNGIPGSKLLRYEAPDLASITLTDIHARFAASRQ